MSTSILTRWRKAFTTDSDGNDALRTVISGDQTLDNLTLTGDIDGGGGHLLNDQTTTNMMSKGTVYRFDGVDDVITVTDSAEIQDIFANGGFISVDIYPLSGGESNTGVIVNKQLAGQGYALNCAVGSGNNIAVTFRRQAATTDGLYTTGAVIPINKRSKLTVVYDDTTPTTAALIYLNGVLITTTDIDVVGALGSDSGVDMRFGNNSAGTEAFDGEIGEVMLGNFAPTADEVKDLISGNLPFKWQYGSQTDILLTDDADWGSDQTTKAGFNGAYTWQASGTVGDADIDVSTNVLTLTGIDAGHGVSYPSAMTVGKYYEFTLNVTAITGTWYVDNGQDATAVITATGQQTLRFISTNASLLLWSVSNGGAITVDQSGGDMTFNPLGAVALYDNTSISETTWYDKANGNDGAVTGAEVLNAPSVTPLLAMHTNTIRLQPGATPGTNINCTDQDLANWGQLAVTDATNLAKSGSSGSFALSASGTILTITLGKEVVGVCGYGLKIHDLNSSSTSEMYFPYANMTDGALTLSFFKRGSISFTDMTTILDSGDAVDVWIQYVTAT